VTYNLPDNIDGLSIGKDKLIVFFCSDFFIY